MFVRVVSRDGGRSRLVCLAVASPAARLDPARVWRTALAKSAGLRRDIGKPTALRLRCLLSRSVPGLHLGGEHMDQPRFNIADPVLERQVQMLLASVEQTWMYASDV
jgi:hypothetical protein